MADAIRFSSVSFSYGKKRVLQEFSFSVAEGEQVCLFSASGRGKTTVLRLIAGLEEPDAGEVFVAPARLRTVFQEDRLLPFLTVLENAAMFAEVGQARKTLAALGLSEEENTCPAALSGGMARRASLARALAGEGDLYLFDEPFAGLDTENTERSAALIRARTEGKTAVFVLHDRPLAEKLGLRLIEM